MPKPAFRTKHVLRNQFLRSTVPRFLIRHVQNIKRRTGPIGVFHLAPSLIDDSPKAALEPDVVFKHKSIGGSGVCDGFPDDDMRPRNGNFCLTLSSVTRQIKRIRYGSSVCSGKNMLRDGV